MILKSYKPIYIRHVQFQIKLIQKQNIKKGRRNNE